MKKILLLASLLSLGASPPPVYAAADSFAPSADRREQDEMDRLRTDLLGSNAEHVRVALDQLRQMVMHSPENRAAIMTVLLDAGRFSDADAIAQECIRSDPTSLTISRMQWLRVQSLIQQRRWPAALSAARTYFNCCEWSDSADAIGLISLCLRNADPRRPELADAFDQQQMVSANSRGAATQPAGTRTGDTRPGDAMPAAEDRPFVSTVDAIRPTDCRTFAQKANLMLLIGRPNDAKALFEQEATLATRQDEFVEAYRGQARAVRAECGCLGPANALIESLQRQR